MCLQQINEQIMYSNKILLENTLAFFQTARLFSSLSEQAPMLKAEKKITRYGKIYKKFYEDYEVSAEHIMSLYKIAQQD